MALQSWPTNGCPRRFGRPAPAALLRADYIPLLCAVAKAGMQFREQPELFPAHTALASVSKDQFNIVFGTVLQSKLDIPKSEAMILSMNQSGLPIEESELVVDRRAHRGPRHTMPAVSIEFTGCVS